MPLYPIINQKTVYDKLPENFYRKNWNIINIKIKLNETKLNRIAIT